MAELSGEGVTVTRNRRVGCLFGVLKSRLRMPGRARARTMPDTALLCFIVSFARIWPCNWSYVKFAFQGF